MNKEQAFKGALSGTPERWLAGLMWMAPTAAVLVWLAVSSIHDSQERDARFECQDSARKHAIATGARLSDVDSLYVGGECIIRDTRDEEKMIHQREVEKEWRKFLEAKR